MATYWGMFIFPVIMTIFSGIFAKDTKIFIWILFGVVLIALVGLRYEVGGDWYSYLYYYRDAVDEKLIDTLRGGRDPGYYFSNWLLAKSGVGIWSINLFCAAITVGGIMSVANRQPLPWAALAVAMPYTIIVVAMGYTRQAAALGLICWALVAIQDRRPWKFILLIIIAATFHKSAVVLTPLFILSLQKIRFYHVIFIVIASIGIVGILVLETLQSQWTNYVETQRESDGAAIRSAMNFIPALIVLIWKKKLGLDGPEARHWYWMAIASFIAPLFVSYAGTAVDRITLYLLPLQMVVFSRVHFIPDNKSMKSIIIALVFTYYAFVAFVWLNYATHADFWLPYTIYPLA